MAGQHRGTRPPVMALAGRRLLLSIWPRAELHSLALQAAIFSGGGHRKVHRFAGAGAAAGAATGTAPMGAAAAGTATGAATGAAVSCARAAGARPAASTTLPHQIFQRFMALLPSFSGSGWSGRPPLVAGRPGLRSGSSFALPRPG